MCKGLALRLVRRVASYPGSQWDLFFSLLTETLGMRLVRRLYGTLIEWISYLVHYICTCACVCATFCSATFMASFILAFFSEVVVNFASTGVWVCTRRKHHSQGLLQVNFTSPIPRPLPSISVLQATV